MQELKSVKTKEKLSSSDVKYQLLKKISERTATVGVVGMGYVGLPFAVEKAKVGFKVVGIEENPKRVQKINEGENYIPDVADGEFSELVSSGKIHATSDYSEVSKLDIVVICVPTPLTKNLTPDLSFIEKVTNALTDHLRPGQLISLESTTYPGTTAEIMLPILLQSGYEVEKDFFLVHSPERVDPGNKRYTTANTNKVIGGIGPASLEVAVSFYSQTIKKVIGVSSSQAAELCKVFENTFRAVNIALVNELAMLCDKMQLNVWEVLDAAFTKPFGILPFYPGPGVGGHCIPLDPHYLEWKAKEFNFDTHFIALAGEINRKMPAFVREKAIRLLNCHGVAPSKAKILFIGMAYKKDLGDTRESPAVEVLKLLKSDGADVVFHDPYVSKIEINGVTHHCVPLTEAMLKAHDLVIITTEHSNIDFAFVCTHAKVVLDTRNVTSKIKKGKCEITLL